MKIKKIHVSAGVKLSANFNSYASDLGVTAILEENDDKDVVVDILNKWLQHRVRADVKQLKKDVKKVKSSANKSGGTDHRYE